MAWLDGEVNTAEGERVFLDKLLENEDRQNEIGE
jgi:hypothetical protein